MRISFLLTALAFVATGFASPAAADSPWGHPTPIAQPEAISTEACLKKAKNDRLAQIDCCKGHKGLCGCRAGKLVCCDGTSSNEPGCTCHGEDGLSE